LSIVLAAIAGAIVLGPAAAEEAPKPQSYKPVPIELPQPYGDPSFDAFRKQIIDIAKRKDRAALAKTMAKTFFWTAADRDVANPKISAIDNLARALDLDGADAEGWETLIAFASEPSADPDMQRKGVICSPGDPKLDVAAAEALAKTTGTTLHAWYFPSTPGLDVRGSTSSDAPVTAKLGLHLVWVYPDPSPAAAVQPDIVRIVLPSGEFGYVQSDALVPLIVDLLCYVKEGNSWRIAGIMGGELPEK
jgi:hypothetical protein